MTDSSKNPGYWTCPKCGRLNFAPRLWWKHGRYYGTCVLCTAEFGALSAAEVKRVAARRRALRLPNDIKGQRHANLDF